ncbi:phospholipase D-like domain-containing protein [Boudabousia marimammalium]|uniref:Cardiolipin synthase B n=1 Tax=Boudabousia marimammalium TaxID=156892 RepID=A0A1Q5PLV9_9ACTO|nr:phospholipase D-like domain-containing protein [Boudabousia marimammalium]OKL48042.1 cardiolipin synthase B [Boudabousia marimammalium]
MSLRKPLFRLRRIRNTAHKALKLWLFGFAALQVITASSIIAHDQFRKRRIPGGDIRYPHLPPQNTTLSKNEVTVYTQGEVLYADMLDSIEKAEHTIYFESFIWKGDQVGQQFKEALIAAAERGVTVYCVFDTFANLVVSPHFKHFPKLPNLHVRAFPLLPPSAFLIRRRLFGRDHRKLLVVDGEVGWVGGYNIGSLYATAWRDTQVRISGPAVWELENSFANFWNDFKKDKQPALPNEGARKWDARIQAIANAPNRLLYPIRGAYLDAINRASKRVWITQAYFIPDREFIDALKKAESRGVDVRVLIPERSNHILADWAAAPYFSELLAAGVEIWQYEHAMVHAKTAVIDGRWCTIGTANIDRLSLSGNFELNLVFHGENTAMVMEKVFLKDLETAHCLTTEEWAKRPWLWRVTERIIRPLGIML